MVFRLIAALVVCLFFPSLSFAVLLDNPRVVAKRLVTSGQFDQAKKLLGNCSFRVGSDYYLECREALIVVVMVHAARKEYAEAGKYLPRLKQTFSADGLRPPAACLNDTVNIGDDFYVLGYEQAAYQIAKGLGSSNADGLALKAFLCANWYSRNDSQKWDARLEGVAMSRAAFISTIQKIYGKRPEFDVQRYIEELAEPTYATIKPLGYNYVKIMTVFKNAEKHCVGTDLDASFCNFYRDLSVEYYHYAKN
ncbi:hypothetical protein GFM44_23250 [Rhizobium leguminosarum bv. viciae]|nr:hypothetical protein [Rhizobium leguminosarum bv. viciae]